MTRAAALLALGVLALLAGCGPERRRVDPAELITEAERTGFERTGRYDEVERLAAALRDAYPDRVTAGSFGTTPEGRRMTAIIAGSGPTVLCFQGGIHAGEIDGKDAGFIALRELLSTPGALDGLEVIFIPVLNVDGHERFGPNNRPNQNGPKEMGWRTTASNRNLNRDYAKADTPEMRALLGLLDAYDPIVYADLHVTDGAEFQPDIAVIVEPSDVGPAGLAAAGAGLRDGALARLRAKGYGAYPFYPSFVRDDDPNSGFAAGSFSPRFSHGYWGARNRIGVLVETHSWKPYARRVAATKETILAIVDLARAHGAEWRAAASAADQEAQRGPSDHVTLTWDAGPKPTATIDFPGYAYTVEKSAVSGGRWIRYDPRKPQVWRVPLRGDLVPDFVVRPPGGGYVVPAGFVDEIAAPLRLHGIEMRVLAGPGHRLPAETFAVTATAFAGAPYEGRTRASFPGSRWVPETVDFASGSLFIPIAQPKARLVMHLMEPAAPDSFAAWGFFNAALQRQEYMEAYVAEQVARDMLARDPVLRREFEGLVKSDAAFAASPEARLDFFYRLHPAFDPAGTRVPVYRVDEAP